MDFPADSWYPGSGTIGTHSLIGLEARASLVVAASATWSAANRAIFIPVIVTAPFVVTQLFVVNGATASGNIDMGIYTTQGNRLVSKGTTAQTGTSVPQVFDITDTLLNPGLYYLAAAMDNATGTVVGFATAGPQTNAMGMLQMATAFPLPDPVTFAASTGQKLPGLHATGKTVV